MGIHGKGGWVVLAASVVFCTTLLAAICGAQEPVANERGRVTLPMQPSSDWNAQLSMGYLPSADLHGTPASVGISEYRFRLTRNLKLDSSVTLTLGGGYGLKHLDAPANAGLPQDLHALYAEAGGNWRVNEKVFVTLKLYPGLNSDFKDIAGSDLRMPVLALGGYSFDSGVTMVGGFVYRVGYHAAELIPALGFTYQPNERWRVDLIAPRPGLTYIASQKAHLFVAGDLASDEYELHDGALRAKVIKYRDYKVMGGVEYLPQPAVRLSAALGYAFGRYFDFYEGNRPSMQLDDAPFLKLSLDVGW